MEFCSWPLTHKKLIAFLPWQCKQKLVGGGERQKIYLLTKFSLGLNQKSTALMKECFHQKSTEKDTTISGLFSLGWISIRSLCSSSTFPQWVRPLNDYNEGCNKEVVISPMTVGKWRGTLSNQIYWEQLSILVVLILYDATGLFRTIWLAPLNSSKNRYLQIVHLCLSALSQTKAAGCLKISIIKSYL